MRAIHDRDADVLRFVTDERGEYSVHLESDPSVVIDLADEQGQRAVAVSIIGASAYLPLGKRGYDADSDTLTLGERPTALYTSVGNGDLAVFWQGTEHGDTGVVCVIVHRASAHMG